MVNASVLGTTAEVLVFVELVRQGKRPGWDFTFQSANMGGRIAKGGLMVDFLFVNPPDLAFNVRAGVGATRSDIMAQAQLAGEGITLIFLDEDMVVQDVSYVVGEALRYRDVSRR